MENSKGNIVRDSNFELLRLLAMFGIIVHHLVIKGASTCGYVEAYDYNRDGVMGLIINSLVVGGVNCFVLITGWFGVRHTMKGLVKILLETCLFGLISYIILLLLGGDSFSISHLIDSLDFRFNWFVVSYMMLLLVCPIIERSLMNLEFKEFKKWMILLCVFNFVFILFLNRVNDNGYNVVHFIFLYYIARFMRTLKNNGNQWYVRFEKYSLPIYIIMVLILTIGFLFLNEYRHAPKSIKWFGYNNPILLIASVSFFVSMAKMRIKSRRINSMASGVFGVFILHTTKYMIPYRNDMTHDVYLNYGYVGIVVLSLIILLAGLIISVPGSKAIRFVMNKNYISTFKN